MTYFSEKLLLCESDDSKPEFNGALKTNIYKLTSKEYKWFNRQKDGFDRKCAPEKTETMKLWNVIWELISIH